MALRETLYAWLREQPLWQQDLARRLVTQAAFTDEELDEQILRVETDLGLLAPGEVGIPSVPIALDDLPLRGATGAPKLVALGRMRGVAAVSDSARLEFAREGMTVVYGPNASGKSSYVRALKRVCRTVPHEQTLHGNAFSTTGSTDSQSAVVEIAANGQLHSQTVDLKNPQTLGLEALSVFDSRCADAYVDAQNEVGFMPQELRLLQRLGETQHRMGERLKAEVFSLKQQVRPLVDLPKETKAASFQSALNPELQGHDVTRLRADLAELTNLNAAAKARLVELRGLVAAANSSQAGEQARVINGTAIQARELAAKLEDLRARMTSDAQANLRRTANASGDADEAVRMASLTFASASVPGVGEGPWKLLWDAAHEFSRHIGAAFPPEEGQACPLCLQPVGDEAQRQMGHFEKHVRSSVQARADQAKVEYQSAYNLVDPRWVGACRTPFLASLEQVEPSLYHELTYFLAAVEERFTAIRTAPWTADEPEISPEAIASLQAWADEQAERAAKLLATQNPQQAKEHWLELAELEAREQLGSHAGQVEAWLVALERLAAVRATLSAVATNALSHKQRALAREAVSAALQQELKRELSELSCSHIPVVVRSSASYAKPQVQLGFDGIQTGGPRIAAVASEGEHRALALGFFLAEIEAGKGDGGLIIDDPVSSLDHDRKLKVAQRLVQAAEQRQVIVFTHDLPFLMDLMNSSRAAGREPKVQSVGRYDGMTGHVEDRPPFDVMGLNDRLAGLSEDHAGWEKQVPASSRREERARVHLFYKGLRDAWERAVEEVLFYGVVTRLRRDVKTMSLRDVVVKPEYLQAVAEGMTRCSMFSHDDPAEAPVPLPSRQEMFDDLQKLYEFKKTVNRARADAKAAAKAAKPAAV